MLLPAAGPAHGLPTAAAPNGRGSDDQPMMDVVVKPVDDAVRQADARLLATMTPEQRGRPTLNTEHALFISSGKGLT